MAALNRSAALAPTAQLHATIGNLLAPRGQANSTEDAVGAWWRNLCALNAPRILYRLPFAGRGNARGDGGDGPDALAIGRMTAEETGDDRTVLVLETDGNLSRTGLSEILTSSNLRPTLLVPDAAGARLVTQRSRALSIKLMICG